MCEQVSVLLLVLQLQVLNNDSASLSFVCFYVCGQVRYECYAGYNISGDAVLSCVDGEWVGDVPSCTRPTCPNPPEVKQKFTTAQSANPVCNTVSILSVGTFVGGYVRSDVCLFRQLEHGFNHCAVGECTSYGLVVTYHCDEGYESSTSASIRLRCDGGQWVGTDGACG